MDSDFKSRLGALQDQINKRIKAFFDRTQKDYQTSPKVVQTMVREARAYVESSGKRLRPILIYYGYLAASGKHSQTILDASIFMEFIHKYLLVHDDIIDKDALRNGFPTVHSQYQKLYLKKSPAQASHLGTSAAIIVGDLLSTWGYQILLESNFSLDRKLVALARLNQLLTDVYAGQMLDVFEMVGQDLSEKKLELIAKLKTSRYTIEGPLQLGAILGGGSPKILNQLSQFSRPLGVVYQIKDDLEEILETKTISSDITQGKQTFPIVYALARAGVKDKKFIKSLAKHGNRSSQDAKRLRRIIIATQADQRCRQKMDKLALAAAKSLESAALPQEAADFLRGFAKWVSA